MVNMEIKISGVDYTIKFTETITDNLVVVRAFSDFYQVEYAEIGNEAYYFDYSKDKISTMVVGTTKKLSNEIKKPIISVINRIIEEGNEYLKTIFNKGIIPTI